MKNSISKTITVCPQTPGIFTPDFETAKPDTVIQGEAIRDYLKYIRPQDDRMAVMRGNECAQAVKDNRIADFEKDSAYCEAHPGDTVDCMVHVSTFTVIDGIIYMTYYANVGTDAEDPTKQEARFAFCSCDNPTERTVVRLQKAGDILDGKVIDRVYDTILMHKDDDVLYLMWTASADGLYYRFYRTYTISTATLSEIRPNRFKAGSVTNDFSVSGIISALAENGIPRKIMFSDIGIMQKITAHIENGETWYYTGAYSGHFNCIIKSRDFITWEYVSSPDFPNLSLWENAVYVRGDRCYYFVRQTDECREGFLTCLDLNTMQWSKPCIISDTQSRSDFIVYGDNLYLVHAPIDRNGFGIIRIDEDKPEDSSPVLVADMKDSLFYPYTKIYGDKVYISYTVNRKHIRLSWFDAGFLSETGFRKNTVK